MDAQLLKDLVKLYPFTVASDDGLSIITGPVRAIFCHLDKPTAPPQTQKEPRYNIFVAVPDFADWSPLKGAAQKAWGASAWAANVPQNIPFKAKTAMVNKKKNSAPWDGSEGMAIGFNAETKTPTTLLDMVAGPDGKPAPMPVDGAYAGMWCRVKVRAQAYNIGNQNGVKFWLQAVQKIADDKRVNNGGDAAEGFTALAPAGNAPAAMPAAGGLANGAAAGGVW